MSTRAGIVALKPTMLIVEDDAAVRHSLRMVLEAFGYAVEEFVDGEDLLAHGPMTNSCVILDIGLPGANGLEILAQLRARRLPVPVVLVSSRATDGLRRQAERFAPLAFLDKPLDIDALLRTVAPLGQ